MKIAYFDCQFGAAGDMLLGALIAAMKDYGIDERLWFSEMDKLALPAGSFKLDVSDVIKGNIAGKKVSVHFDDQHEERHLSEILSIIERSRISNKAKELAAKIFRNLAIAESKVHGMDIDEVHFHEVGAIDAIVDIVGFAVAYDLLGIEKSVVSSVPVGTGCVKTEHGLFPIPGPAVLNLLASVQAPVKESPIDYECLTPTGAAILVTVGTTWGTCPAMQMQSVGYGAGTFEPKAWPNVSRIVIGEGDLSSSQSEYSQEDVAVVEANIDDMSPQVLSYAMEKLFAEGALDVSVIPCTMKKGRSGSLVSVVCRVPDQRKMQEIILAETTTLGVRSHICRRLFAERKCHDVVLSAGEKVRVKVAMDSRGAVVNVQPEYEDCAGYARRHGEPLKKVLNEALVVFQNDSGLVV